MKTGALGKFSELSLADKAMKQHSFLQLNNRACLVSCSSSIYIPNSQMGNFSTIWMPSDWGEQRESQQGGPKNEKMEFRSWSAPKSVDDQNDNLLDFKGLQ